MGNRGQRAIAERLGVEAILEWRTDLDWNQLTQDVRLYAAEWVRLPSASSMAVAIML